MSLALILIGWKGLSMRKEIQSQEILPLNGKIITLTASTYLIDKIKITLRYPSGKEEKKTYDDKGMAVFDGLSNDISYAVEFKRTDLKGSLLYKTLKIRATPSKNKKKYFVLVGASIGQKWNFPKLPDRVNLGKDIILGSRIMWDFDKSSKIEALTALSVPITGVIIKECAAYFPRELGPSLQQIIKWVEKLRFNNITPILATVVPVTKEHDKQNPGKFDSILAFNNSIRSYALKENLPVLDLEKALRISKNDRHLKNEYAVPDGVHLVKKAYDEALDKIVLPVLESIHK